MGYHNSNAAYAYDMQPRSYGSAAPSWAPRTPAPQPAQPPRLDVVPGAGREANQAISPSFAHVIKVFMVLAAIFCAVGLFRITAASITATTLNANAQISSSLDEARTQSTDLEVMRSVYGSSSRIRELAVDTLGMVEGKADSVTIDVSDAAAAVAE